ncbi:hypothetical protein I6A60_31260 [Frankia sp. AgB1.9]|uniref:hypothetical protein n=1 Tax=unclassified Frankia TaxID=2632575 RepID=UPI001931B096|nr:MULTISPECIES: hypothetical protein [unclassified Frankia]MBL7493892.1 hypothetical protein [Frankia sp. AgW1.1]MBL7552309.1 hypothetical protein [Frankia sp. AgB1.9]MBL7622062.1 hypothetical protein [Frankia sp. AgB1.8]
MDIVITGRPTEVLVAIDALELILCVEEASVPEPTDDGRVRVHAVVIDPEAPENQPTDAEVASALGIPPPQ